MPFVLMPRLHIVRPERLRTILEVHPQAAWVVVDGSTATWNLTRLGTGR